MRRSTTLIRSWRVSTVSPARTGTASWARIGPASSSMVATWTGHPGTFTPAPRAALELHGRDVDGAPGHLHAGLEGVPHGMGSLERRQERRVGVEHPTLVGV